jgi:hypothetical protein
LFFEGGNHFRGCCAGTVICNDDIKVRMGLLFVSPQYFLEPLRLIVCADDNRDMHKVINCFRKPDSTKLVVTGKVFQMEPVIEILWIGEPSCNDVKELPCNIRLLPVVLLSNAGLSNGKKIVA